MRTAKTLFRAMSILVLLACLLTVSGASASGGTPVSGTQTIVLAGPVERVWTSGKWTHVQGDLNTGTFAFSGDGISLSGSVTRLDNVRADADGNGVLQGYITYVDESTGITCQGPSNGVLTIWALAGSVLAHCSDGSTLHGSLQDTGVVFDSQGNLIGVESAFSGTLFSPGR